MARDKYPRPCLPLKPQEKKFRYIYSYTSIFNKNTCLLIKLRLIKWKIGPRAVKVFK